MVRGVTVLRLYKGDACPLLAVVSAFGDLEFKLRRGGRDDGAAAEAARHDDVSVRRAGAAHSLPCAMDQSASSATKPTRAFCSSSPRPAEASPLMLLRSGSGHPVPAERGVNAVVKGAKGRSKLFQEFFFSLE